MGASLVANDRFDASLIDALCQIEDKGYAREYSNDSRQLYKIGCSFSSDTGTVEWWLRVHPSCQCLMASIIMTYWGWSEKLFTK